MELPPEPLVGTHWSKLTEARRAEMLEAAKQAYRDDFAWDALPAVAQAWAALNLAKVVPDEDPRLKTYPCPKHTETPFIVGADNTAWPCDSCEAGTKVDAAVWFERIYTKRGRKFIRKDSEYAKFLSYLRQRPNGVALRDAVNRLLDAEESKPLDPSL